jgi:hypothetical protein
MPTLRSRRQPITATRVAAVAVAAGMAIAAPFAASQAGASPHPRWSPVSSPSPVTGAGATNHLTAVSCHGPKSCVAVGVGATHSGITTNLLLRLEGTTWKKATPVGQGNALGLSAIACPTTSWCMAVGARNVAGRGSEPAAQTVTTTAAHFAMTGLIETAPAPSGGTFDPIALTAISCRSPQFCVAVGMKTDNNNLRTIPVTIRWNGQRWKTLHTPNPGVNASYNGVQFLGTSLTGVHCLSTHDCLAVGTDLKVTSPPGMEQSSSNFTMAMQYNGSAWHVTPTPSVTSSNAPARPKDGLSGLACPSSSVCFATGNVSVHAIDYGFIERWNGGAWSISHSEGTTPYSFGPIACGSTSSCDTPAIPSDGLGATLYLPMVHWNGTHWVIQGTHVRETDTISALTCVSVSRCWAVGSQPPATGSGSHTLIARK